MYLRTLRFILMWSVLWCGHVLAQVDSLAVLKNAVMQSPKDGDAWVRLGYAYLDVDSLAQAEEAFYKAEKYVKSARVYNGLGWIWAKKNPRFARKAFPMFRKALQVDPMSLETHLSIARVHKMLGDQDAEGAFRKVMEMDSTYAPVYLELAQWYLDKGYEGYYDEIRPLYKKYIALRPDDVDGHYGLALNYTDQKDYGAVLDLAITVIELNGIDGQWAALMGQAYAARGEPDKAVALFEQYLKRVDDEERALYEDLRLVARDEELIAYAQLSAENKQAFLDKFWRKRDPLLVSGGRARLSEHYRRVWYARTYFAEKVQPWDKRGEIYIRYGEPDYRSRSGYPNRPPTGAVEAVKRKIAYQIYEIGSTPRGEVSKFFNMYMPEPWISATKSWRWLTPPGRDGLEYWRKPADVENELYIGPIYAIDRNSDSASSVPWESWVYTQVGDGIEFVFTDQMMNGAWDFPPMPYGVLSSQLVSYMETHNSAIVLQTVKSETPDYFDVPPGLEVLAFYYDVAQFRGKLGETRTEVYFGIPPTEIELRNGRGSVSRILAVVDLDGEEVYRNEASMTMTIRDTSTLKSGAFAPEVASIDLTPGEYQLAVQVTDKNSGKWGVYAQELNVVEFADSLAMSDLEMAFDIATYPKDQQFKKGDVWVIPMPSRHYLRSQNPSVYYEVYNLTHNEFGQTHYRVDYTIQQDVRKGGGLFGSLGAGLKKAMTSGKPQVVVGYEREGQASWEPIYLELDIQQAKAGLNQIVVTVTDLVSGQSVSQQALFQLSQ